MRQIVLGAIGVFLLVGCTSYPPSPSATVNAEEINYAILTELYCATSAPEFQGYPISSNIKPDGQGSYFASEDNWVAAVDLFLSASIEGSAGALVSFLGPFNLAKSVPTLPTAGSTGSFTAAFGGTFDQTRTNLREYKIFIFLPTFIYGSKNASIENWKQFAHDHHWDFECLDGKPTNIRWTESTMPTYYIHGRYLEGELGLEKWLVPAVYTEQSTQQFAPPAPSATDKNFRQDLIERFRPFLLATGASPGGGGSQNPTIGATITFTIKATGTIGPSFTLSRVSGGSASLFSLTRTDNNYVNIVLTPVTYCWTELDPTKTQKCPDPFKLGIEAARTEFQGLYVQSAIDRINATLVNLNLAHLLSP
jgi:hypothetical protein